MSPAKQAGKLLGAPILHRGEAQISIPPNAGGCHACLLEAQAAAQSLESGRTQGRFFSPANSCKLLVGFLGRRCGRAKSISR